MAETSLTKSQEKNLANFIRECEYTKIDNDYLTERLDKCEFERSCGWSKFQIAFLISLAAGAGYVMGSR